MRLSEETVTPGLKSTSSDKVYLIAARQQCNEGIGWRLFRDGCSVEIVESGEKMCSFLRAYSEI